MKVLGGVFVLRRVATTDMATLQAEPQVHPAVAHLYAFFADVDVGIGDLD